MDIGEEESESTNWHLNQSITASVEIGGDAQGYKVGLSTTTEAGGGGEKGSGGSSNAGTLVRAGIPEDKKHADDPNWKGKVVVETIARRYRVKQEIIRRLRNKRTGDETSQSGEIDAKRFEFDHSNQRVPN